VARRESNADSESAVTEAASLGHSHEIIHRIEETHGNENSLVREPFRREAVFMIAHSPFVTVPDGAGRNARFPLPAGRDQFVGLPGRNPSKHLGAKSTSVASSNAKPKVGRISRAD